MTKKQKRKLLKFASLCGIQARKTLDKIELEALGSKKKFKEFREKYPIRQYV